jgi:hypothetical protein
MRDLGQMIRHVYVGIRTSPDLNHRGRRMMRITQVSSGLIATQMLTSVAAPCACTAPAPNGTFNPRARPPPATAAEPTMNVRRESFVRNSPRGAVVCEFHTSAAWRPAWP